MLYLFFVISNKGISDRHTKRAINSILAEWKGAASLTANLYCSVIRLASPGGIDEASSTWLPDIFSDSRPVRVDSGDASVI